MSLGEIIKYYPISEYLDPQKMEKAEDAESLTKLLFPAVHRLLAESPEMLFNTLYRIDVNESLVKQALEKDGTENQAAQISKLIAERLLEKLAFRRKYGGG